MAAAEQKVAVSDFFAEVRAGERQRERRNVVDIFVGGGRFS